MTGIERLHEVVRELGRFSFCYDLYETLGDIADQIERERECDADTIENLRLELGEARDEAAWVREHGGLEAVKRLLDWVVGHCSTRQQLDFDFWLSGRVMHELGFEEDMADRDEVERRLLARLMPEGMEWPRFESGEPVRIGDVVSDVEVRSVVFRDGGILLSDCTSVPGWGTWRSYKEPIKRSAPKVPDADGVEIFTHARPVPGADGKNLLRGETVYNVVDGEECRVLGFSDRTLDVNVMGEDGSTKAVCHDVLTHERPDSFEQLEKDANDLIYDIGFHLGDYSPSDFKEEDDSVQDRVRDLVRRAKKLAERGQ